jgi:aminocarboxymuconate-semialdehyde decarboxylase
MAIDIHAHIVQQDYLDKLVHTAGLTTTHAEGKTFYQQRGYTVAWSRPDMFDIEGRIRAMDAKQIAIRVLSLSTPNVYVWTGAAQIQACRAINDHLHEACRRYPSRFVGLASLPLSDIPASLAELDRCIGELEMRGVVLGSNIDGMALDDDRLEPLWARLNTLRLPIFVHPMFPSYADALHDYELPLRLGFPFDTTTAAARLIYSGVLARYPDLVIILAHTGGALLPLVERLDNGYRLFPECRRYIDELPSVYAKRLYYDTASFSAPLIEMAVNFAGADHVLFGTDDPFIDQSADHVHATGLSSGDKTAVLEGNARRLLSI